ncbi:hypothetical protein BV898_17376 [Hypsibius exemplaris]|uniref:Uncharacterized protein n=1 Tax=Hypsibius exemplaris TaxID=2072580 RepID=A0A9X6NGS0_HYPEX|nr:hypothetical protein BV898_17376 [Hypsibius exemplaris]
MVVFLPALNDPFYYEVACPVRRAVCRRGLGVGHHVKWTFLVALYYGFSLDTVGCIFRLEEMRDCYLFMQLLVCVLPVTVILMTIPAIAIDMVPIIDVIAEPWLELGVVDHRIPTRWTAPSNTYLTDGIKGGRPFGPSNIHLTDGIKDGRPSGLSNTYLTDGIKGGRPSGPSNTYFTNGIKAGNLTDGMKGGNRPDGMKGGNRPDLRTPA